MMFALREIAVSLTFFVVLYCLLSMPIAAGWRFLQALRMTERTRARFLFGLRVLPLAAAMVVTLALVIPSFQLLEPRSSDEGMGTLPLALGICALLLLATGCLRVIAAQARSARVVASWLKNALPLSRQSDIVPSVLRSESSAPPLALVGLLRPRVLVSESALALLHQDELQIALKHERAHMRSRDNLKKLIFRFCPFPGMGKLESAWSQAAEMAADDAAVSNGEDALDLAAALVKLSRLAPVNTAPVCAVGFLTGTLAGTIGARVARLLAWDQTSRLHSRRGSVRYALPALFLSGAFLLVGYGPALTLTHALTEWLVQ